MLYFQTIKVKIRDISNNNIKGIPVTSKDIKSGGVITAKIIHIPKIVQGRNRATDINIALFLGFPIFICMYINIMGIKRKRKEKIDSEIYKESTLLIWGAQ